MTTADRAKLREQLIRHEGLRLKPYRCPAGYLTIGVGRNLEGKGICADEAMALLERDLDECEQDLQLRLPVYRDLSPVRQRALIDMRFQLGSRGFFGFKRMLNALNRHDYESAAQHGFASKWARTDSPQRAQRVLTMLETGLEAA